MVRILDSVVGWECVTRWMGCERTLLTRSSDKKELKLAISYFVFSCLVVSVEWTIKLNYYFFARNKTDILLMPLRFRPTNMLIFYFLLIDFIKSWIRNLIVNQINDILFQFQFCVNCMLILLLYFPTSIKDKPGSFKVGCIQLYLLIYSWYISHFRD